MSKRRRPKSVNGDRQSNREATAAGRNGQQSQTPQGPIEAVVVQGPLERPAPVDADEPGRVMPSSLPSAAVIGSTSEPERMSEQQTTTNHTPPSLVPQRGSGVEPRGEPPVLEDLIQNANDITLIGKMLSDPEWEIDPRIIRALPNFLTMVMLDQQEKTVRRPIHNADGKVVDYEWVIRKGGWSETARIRAANQLVGLKERKRHNLYRGARLKQMHDGIGVPGINFNQQNLVFYVPDDGRNPEITARRQTQIGRSIEGRVITGDAT